MGKINYTIKLLLLLWFCTQYVRRFVEAKFKWLFHGEGGFLSVDLECAKKEETLK